MNLIAGPLFIVLGVVFVAMGLSMLGEGVLTAMRWLLR